MDEIHFQKIYRIEATRLVGWDYSNPGWYFVTFCTKDKQYYFDNPKVKEIATNFIKTIPDHFPNAVLGEWVVMPNHVHIAINITGFVTDHGRSICPPVETLHATSLHESNNNYFVTPLTSRSDSNSSDNSNYYSLISPKPGSLPTIIRSYKSSVSKLIHDQGIQFGWQERFFDHVIRNEKSLHFIEEYIRDNPANWTRDRNFVPE